jgi:hypothetical protein
MTTRALPQQYCEDQTDHKAHPWVAPANSFSRWPARRCPGRYTPSNHRPPATVPAVPADPFALIPGAYDE